MSGPGPAPGGQVAVGHRLHRIGALSPILKGWVVLQCRPKKAVAPSPPMSGEQYSVCRTCERIFEVRYELAKLAVASGPGTDSVGGK